MPPGGDLGLQDGRKHQVQLVMGLRRKPAHPVTSLGHTYEPEPGDVLVIGQETRKASADDIREILARPWRVLRINGDRIELRPAA